MPSTKKTITTRSTSKVALSALIAALAASSSHGFAPVLSNSRTNTVQHSLSSGNPSSQSPLSSRIIATPSHQSSTARSMTLEDVNTFYQTYPLQAAVLTCGVKASLADCVAQIRSWTKSERAIELRRNAAYIIYGGIFIGLMCHIEYDILFPQLFGTSHDLKNVVQSVLFDNFVSAPLMWLPPAYLIKAVMFDYPLQEGLEKYVADIRDEGLLFKYWAVWLPAQTISFSCVPDQLRVLFMACVSFGWFIILSSCQAAKQSQQQQLQEGCALEESTVAALSSEEPVVVAAESS